MMPRNSFIAGNKEVCARFGRPFAVAIVFLIGFSGTTRAANFTVSFDRNPITLGENAVLSLTFEGGPPAAVPSIPQIANLEISSPPGRTSQYTFVNGVTSTTESYTYTVTPTQPGDYTIPALTAQIGGQTVTSQAVKLTVLKPGAPLSATDANGGGAVAFVRLVVPKQKVFVGEVIQARLELCLRADVINIQKVQLEPVSAPGFTVGKDVEGQRTRAHVGDADYTIIPVNMIFTAAKAGTLTLGPPTCTLDLLFGPVDFFGRATRSQHVTLTGDAVTVQSVPLPADNKPPGFNGAVGKYSLSVSVAPTNIAVGDPITVTIQISGRGVVDALTLPDQTGWEQFKLYPPTSDYQSSDQLDLSGTKTFKLTAVPESLDVKELPSFTFSYFDPDLNAYHTLSQPAVPLIVRPSAASLPPLILAGANAASDNPAPKQDIIHIKPWLGTVTQLQPPLVTRTWFLALQGVPVLAWLCLFAVRRQQDQLAANPRLRRQREVERTLRDGLRDLRHYAAANDAEQFFAVLFHLLQERLGERLDLPASAITEAVLDERLLPLGVPESIIDRLRGLFHTCNQARYAPQTSTEELASLIPQIEAALGELKDLKT
jgi:BatD DUF11 like domain